MKRTDSEPGLLVGGRPHNVVPVPFEPPGMWMQHELFPDDVDEKVAQKGIGGSELAAIFGLHPRLSARTLWRLKTGRRVAVQRSEAMERGVRLEPVVRHLYEVHSGERLRSGWRGKHPRWSEGVAMIAATDGTLLDGGIFEAKTTHFDTSRYVDFSAGRVPVEVALQLQHYAAVCQTGGVIACLTGPGHALPWRGERWELAVIRWRRLPALCALIEASVAEWVARHVLADKRPEGVHPAADEVLRRLSEAAWTDPPEHSSGDALEAPTAVSQMDLFQGLSASWDRGRRG